MRAAFFYDNRFGRDASGVFYTYGALGYRVLARYLAYFDTLVVVGRVQALNGSMKTIASGPRIELACTEVLSPLRLMHGLAVRRHVREVMKHIDCAIIRLPSAIGEVACREAVRVEKPWMIEMVGCPWDALWNHGSLAGKLLAGRSFLQTRYWAHRAPFATYVSRAFLQRRYPCSGVSLGCSDVLIGAPVGEVLEHRLRRIDESIGGRPVALGLVGPLNVDYKGHETALRALALLVRAAPRLRLCLLGDGDPSRWRKRAAELGVEGNVEFCGSLSDGHAVLEWMDGLDVLIAPSRTEGHGRAIVEAMSRGLPVIGSDRGGIPELIDRACTHPPRDHNAMAQLVNALLENPDRMKELARRNWLTARGYAADVLEERRERFFREFKAYAGREGPRAEARNQQGSREGGLML
jgi:glycosyltransferase involved in cell wall biosynthesis